MKKFNKKTIFFFVILFIFLIILTQKSKVPEEVDDYEEVNQYTVLRKQMVDTQLRNRDITDEIVLRAMENVPRHKFMPSFHNQAYENHPVPIGYGQTISQPTTVMLMIEALELKKTDKVLEVGAGSGWCRCAAASRVPRSTPLRWSWIRLCTSMAVRMSRGCFPCRTRSTFMPSAWRMTRTLSSSVDAGRCPRCPGVNPVP